MGRRRKKRQRGEQKAHRDAVFTDHVPVGRKPCSWCCGAQSGLAVGPGFFRDTDIDGGSGRYGVCCNCAGTGIELGLSSDVRNELMRCRFERSSIIDGRIPRLEQERNFADVMGAGRTKVCSIIDRAIAALDAPERGEAEQRALVTCSTVLDTLFPREDFEERNYRVRLKALGACRCRSDRAEACSCRTYRDRLVAERETVCILVPEMGTAEYQQLATALAPVAIRCFEELRSAVKWAEDPLPYEEFKLLLLVRWYWLEAGRPTGCYAERLVQMLEDLLNPPPPAPRRVIAPQAAARFQSPEFPPELEGLDGALLADLHDCVSRFGGEDHTDHVRRGSLREPVEVHVCVSTKPDNRTIMIIGPGGQTTEGAHMFRLSGLPQAMVIWDNRLRVEDICAFIARMDEIMAERGFVDPKTGARTKVVSDHPTPKGSVDRVFAKPGTCMPVLPGGPDAETMRQEFDRPDDIAIVANPFGGQVLCHQRDVPLIQRREVVAKRVLARHGLTTIDEIGGISWDRVLELREEIERETAREVS